MPPDSQPGRQAAEGKSGESVLSAAVTAQRLGQRAELKRILVPIDFTTASLVALEYAASLAAPFGSTVHLLHVLEPHGVIAAPGTLEPRGLEEQTARAHAKFRRLIERFWPPSLPVETGVDSGMVAFDIVRAADELGSDLIILTTHDLRGIKHLISRHIAEWVMRDTPCPVLFVQAPDPVALDLGPEPDLSQSP